ncbi:MAG: terminase small subunit [Oligoflexia bacterium]|nr:terminase small subunit [Oligoflexia bacterium]
MSNDVIEQELRFAKYYSDQKTPKNVARAARDAGYKEKIARQTGYRLLKKSHVKTFLEAKTTSRQNQSSATTEEFIEKEASVEPKVEENIATKSCPAVNQNEKESIKPDSFPPVESKGLVETIEDTINQLQLLYSDDLDFYKKRSILELQLKSMFELAKLKGMYKKSGEDDLENTSEYKRLVKRAMTMTEEEEKKLREEMDEAERVLGNRSYQ